MAHEKPLRAWLHLWHCYKNPFNLLLTALAAPSWLTQVAKATVVIGAMVVLSTVIRFVQEGRSSRAAASLKAPISNTAAMLGGLPGPSVYAQAVPPTAANATTPPRIELPLRELVVARLRPFAHRVLCRRAAVAEAPEAASGMNGPMLAINSRSSLLRSTVAVEVLDAIGQRFGRPASCASSRSHAIRVALITSTSQILGSLNN